MQEFLRSTPAQAVIWVAVLSIVSCIAIYVVKRIREDNEADDEATSNQMLTRFRGMHDDGEITQTEFKRIKSVLGGRLQQELDSNDSEGDG
jgi:uncharacterized membrane protein